MICWQSLVRSFSSVCRNLKSSCLTCRPPDLRPAGGRARHSVADGYFSRPIFLPQAFLFLASLCGWAYCAGCRDEAFGILLNPPDFPVVISNCCHWAHQRLILLICSVEMYDLWTLVILFPEKKDGERRWSFKKTLRNSQNYCFFSLLDKCIVSPLPWVVTILPWWNNKQWVITCHTS